MSEQREQPATDPPHAGQTATGQASAISLEKLAEKVYQLWRADARLSRARGQTRNPRR